MIARLCHVGVFFGFLAAFVIVFSVALMFFNVLPIQERAEVIVVTIALGVYLFRARDLE
jgi:hypothetical protein